MAEIPYDFRKDNFYKTLEWLKVRNKVKKYKINTKCPICGYLLLKQQRLVVDHIIPRRKLPKSRWLEIGNLQLLHSTCHEKSKQIIERNSHKIPVEFDGINPDWK